MDTCMCIPLQPMTASFPRPDDREAARAERRVWMQTMCPMHQTMVSAATLVRCKVVRDYVGAVSAISVIIHATSHASRAKQVADM